MSNPPSLSSPFRLVLLWLCILTSAARADGVADVFSAQAVDFLRIDILAGLPAQGNLPTKDIYTGFPGLVGNPAAIAFDSFVCAYIADSKNDAILELSGYVHVRFESKKGATKTDDERSRLSRPSGIALDSMNRIHVADTGRHAIRRLVYTSEQTLETLAGGVDEPGSTDGPGSQARFREPTGLVFASDQVLYVADTGNHAIRKITLGAPPLVANVSTVAGLAGQSGHVNATGGAARFSSPRGLALDTEGNLYVADAGNHVIRKITPAGAVSTLAGQPGQAGYANGLGANARFDTPTGIKLPPAGDLLVADSGNHVIRRVSLAGEASLHSGSPGVNGSADGTLPEVGYAFPEDVAIHRTGGWLVVADAGNHLIRMSQPTSPSVLGTIAGSRAGAGSVDAIGFDARFSSPEAVSIDGETVYVADTANHTLRRVGLKTRAAETLAGEAGTPGRVDGVGADARLHSPAALARGDGVIYVADAGSHSVRRLTLPDLRLETVAGFSGVAGQTDGSLEEAAFSAPRGLALSPNGDLFVADSGNHVIRRVSLISGEVSTFAGLKGQAGAADGQGGEARFDTPLHLAFDSSGDLLVADSGNGAIRRVTAEGRVSTLTQPDGSPLPLKRPHGLVLGPRDDVFITDAEDHTLWVKSPAFPLALAAGQSGRTGVSLPSRVPRRLDAPAGLALGADGSLVIANRGGSFLSVATSWPITFDYSYAYFTYEKSAINHLHGRWAITAYELGDLPPGIVYDPEHHWLSGTPAKAGRFLVPITAHNPLKTIHTTLTVEVTPAHIPYSITAPDRAYDGTPKAVVFHNPRPDVAHTWRYYGNGGYTTNPPIEVGTYFAEIFTTDPNFHGRALEWFSIVPGALQTISFPTLPERVIEARFTLNATASSGLPVSFQIVAGDATLQTDGRTVRLGATPGTVTIRAVQPGGVNKGVTYAPADISERTFQVTSDPAYRSQTINFPKPPPATYGDDPLTLVASASSGLPVEFELLSTTPADIAFLDGDRLSIVGAGDVTVRAVQPGAYPYKPATPVVRTLSVRKAVITVSIADAIRAVGKPNPGFELSYEGFVGNDWEFDLATLPSAVTTAKVQSPAGLYPVTIKGGFDPNYTFRLGVPGRLELVGFGGDYEALLLDERSVPVGKLELDIPANSLRFTGSVTLAGSRKPLAIRGEFAPGPELKDATAVFSATAADDTSFDFDLAVSSDGSLSGSINRASEPFARLDFGYVLFVPVKGRPVSWTGAHTMVLHPPAALFSEDKKPTPQGFGYATATIDAKGNLKLVGKLADGFPLTASLKPDIPLEDADSGPAYRLFTNPYGKRLDSFIAGSIALQSHWNQERFPRRHFIPAGETSLTWQKARSPAKPLDASYRAGFGPLAVPIALDPWLPPAKATKTRAAITLPERLGLIPPGSGTDTPFQFDFLGDALTDAEVLALPSALTLRANGTITPPSPNPRSVRLSVSPSTGAFSGSFTLSDQVAPPPAKPIVRKVTISGTLRQGPAGSAETLGHAHLLFDPVPGDSGPDSDEKVSSGLILTP